MAAGVKVDVLMQFEHLSYQNERTSKFSLKGIFHLRSLSNIFSSDSRSESLSSMSITSPWIEYSYMTAENCLVILKLCIRTDRDYLSHCIHIYCQRHHPKLPCSTAKMVRVLFRTAWGVSRLNPTEQLSSVERSLSAVVVCWWHTQVLGCHFVCFWKVRQILVLLCLINTTFAYS
jgi:hypothetical protein